MHDGKNHVFFVTKGQASLILGGDLVAPREDSTGEWRAPKWANSKTVDVGKGDLIFIPHGTVHGRSNKGKKLRDHDRFLLPRRSPAAPAARVSFEVTAAARSTCRRPA